MPPLLHHLRILLVALVLWAAFYALISLDLYLVLARYAAVQFAQLYVESLPSVVIWTVLTPCVLALRRQRPLNGAGLGRALTDHALCSLVVALSLFVISTARTIWHFDLPITGFFQVAASEFTLRSLLHLSNYWLILGVAHLHEVYLSFRFGERRAEALRHQLGTAQLAALRTRLEPHFLFNTFNSVSSLIAQNKRDDAIRMISDISALLRQSLELHHSAEIPLRQEIEFAHRYLEIERTRFPDRILYERDVDSAVLDMPVPSLILQPLFENAIKHGVSRMSGICHIEFAARKSPRGAAITLTNETPMPSGLPMETSSLGVGLRTTKERLQHIYGDAAQLSARQISEGRFSIEVLLPFPRT
jgi:sensor histidine kinase YesM